jgi:hypothetical protein
MRFLVLLFALPLLAGAQGGCSSQNAKPGVGESPARKTAGDSTAKDVGRAPDPDGRPKSADRDEPAPRPAMETAHTGSDQRPKREQELPAGVLTAGSFDDNIYPAFFRTFAGKAGQNQHLGGITNKLLGRRVEIFVKNGQGAPVGNARIRVSAANQRSVELVTRSDGRAIFLSSLDGMEADDDLSIAVSVNGGDSVTAAVEKGADRVTVLLPNASAPLPRNLDLTIVLDTTGSMGDELNFLKAEIKDIAAAIKERFPNVNQRYSLVCYRDEGMGDEYVVRKFEFTGDVNEFRRNLSAQSAAGGGDTPEAMQRGLEEAVKLQWRDADTARVLFLVADAPPHGRDAGATLNHINSLRKKGIAIYPVFASCNDPQASEATEVVMRAAALVTGGQYLFLTDDSGVGDAHGEPHIPYYHVEKLNQLMVRMIAGELSGKRTDPEPKSILRTVGAPPKRGRQD